MSEPGGDITRLLAEWTGDGRAVMDRVFPLVYEELQRVAHLQLRAERADHTLDTKALVHEAYLRLAGSDRIAFQNRAHFFAIAARAMRRILINHAEAHNARKRGGRWRRVPLAENTAVSTDRPDRLIALDRALERLASLNERQCRIVECRWFAGMSVEETAAGLGISATTVKREWALARAWLNRELAG